MRVCFVTGEFPPMQGGVGDYTAELARAMAELGAEVEIVTSTAAASPPWAQEPWRRHAIIHGWGWRSLARVSAVVRNARLDVVHIQYQAAAYGMRPAIHLLPLWLRHVAPLALRLVTFHDLKVPYLFPKAGPLRRRALTALMRGCHAVIVTNREDELAYPGFGAGRPLSVIPIGSNIAPSLPAGFDRTAWRQGRGLASSDLVLCYFGFQNASKGGRTLVRALGMLAAEGAPAKLIMIGGPSGASDPTNRREGDAVDQLIASLGLQGRVVWTGFVPPTEVSAAFAASDLAVLPYTDGVSLRRGSLHAALAHGMAVVTTRPQVSLPELVHSENIWLAPPEDPEAIAGAVRIIAADPELRVRLGQGARALADQFTWGSIARRTMDLYAALSRARGDG